VVRKELPVKKDEGEGTWGKNWLAGAKKEPGYENESKRTKPKKENEGERLWQ